MSEPAGETPVIMVVLGPQKGCVDVRVMTVISEYRLTPTAAESVIRGLVVGY